MITSQGLKQLGFKLDTDYVLEDDGSGVRISEWNSAQPQPTVPEIEAAHAEWQVGWDAQAYARNRKPEYPSIEECVHAILDDDLVSLQAKRSAVKEKYPKV